MTLKSVTDKGIPPLPQSSITTSLEEEKEKIYISVAGDLVRAATDILCNHLDDAVRERGSRD